MDLSENLHEFGKEFGINDLRLDKDGVCTLKINEKHTVAFENSLDGEGFFIYSVIGTIPIGKESKLALDALNANLFGKETGKSSIGYDPVSRSLVIFRFINSQQTDYQLFKEEVKKFEGYLDYWDKNFDRGGGGEKDANEQEPMRQFLEESSRKKQNIQFFA